jgi:hypothetical protein
MTKNAWITKDESHWETAGTKIYKEKTSTKMK